MPFRRRPALLRQKCNGQSGCAIPGPCCAANSELLWVIVAGGELIAAMGLAFVSMAFQITAGSRVARAGNSGFKKIVEIETLIDKAIAQPTLLQ